MHAVTGDSHEKRRIFARLFANQSFDSLPLSPKAFFVIEEFDGHWGWPDYKKRKTLGRLRR